MSSHAMTAWYDVTWFLAGPPLLKVMVRVKQWDTDVLDSAGNMARAYATARARYVEILGREPPETYQVRGVDPDQPDSHWSFPTRREGARGER